MNCFKNFILIVFFFMIAQGSLRSENPENKFDHLQIEKNIEKIDRNILIIRESIKNPSDTLKNFIRENMQLSIDTEYQPGIAWNYFFIGRYYQLTLQNDSAIYYYKITWELATSNNMKDLANATSIGLANVYWETGNYSSGLEFSIEAKSYFEEHEIIDDKYSLFNLIALNYEGLFEFDAALENFEKALSIADKLGKEVFVGIIYSNIGRLYSKQKDYSKSLEFLLRGVKIEEKHQFFSNAGKSYTMIANSYLKINQIDSSLKYLKKAYHNNVNTNDEVGLTRTYLTYGEYYYQIEQFGTSMEYLSKTIGLAEKINLNNELLNAYKLLAQNYEQTGNYKMSTENYIKYLDIYKRIYNVEKINRVNALEHRLKLQTKETEISLLKLKEEKQTKGILIVTTLSFIAISFILILFLFYYRKNNKLLKLKNEEIINQTAILERLNEKLILAEKNAGKMDEMQNMFLNNLTHEIRTPLNGIVGFSSLIAESKLPEYEKARTWNIIRENSEYLINTIEGLLKLSMIASNKMEVKKKKINVDDFLADINNEVTVKYKKILNNKIYLKYTPDKGSNLQINSDINILTQIILNILDNAFKFTHKGLITLGFKTENNHVQMYVSDTGIGILEELKGSIFKQFTKGLNIPVNSPGLGIGLTISKQLTQLLGGDIYYKTIINQGSTFYVSLPLE